MSTLGLLGMTRDFSYIPQIKYALIPQLSGPLVYDAACVLLGESPDQEIDDQRNGIDRQNSPCDDTDDLQPLPYLLLFFRSHDLCPRSIQFCCDRYFPQHQFIIFSETVGSKAFCEFLKIRISYF